MQLVRQCLHVKSANIINLYSQSLLSTARVYISTHILYKVFILSKLGICLLYIYNIKATKLHKSQY